MKIQRVESISVPFCTLKRGDVFELLDWQNGRAFLRMHACPESRMNSVTLDDGTQYQIVSDAPCRVLDATLHIKP